MDGASKFVRGDAVAGILILVINIIGGLAIGMAQHNLDFSTAMEYYSLLTIGDGLVAQIPGLLLSTAAAIMVTRVNSSEEMGKQVAAQMFASPKALFVAAAILGVMGVVPGMPHFAFLALAAIAAAGGYWIAHRNQQEQAAEAEAAQLPVEAEQQPAEEKPRVKLGGYGPRRYDRFRGWLSLDSSGG